MFSIMKLSRACVACRAVDYQIDRATTVGLLMLVNRHVNAGMYMCMCTLAVSQTRDRAIDRYASRSARALAIALSIEAGHGFS